MKNKLSFDPELHRYTLDGALLPSVTKIIEEIVDHGCPWGTEESLIRGREVHTLLAQYDRGEELDLELKARHLGRLNAWMRFRIGTGFAPDLIEESVANETYRYAGTLDRRGFWHGGRPLLLDIKSGKVPWSASFQLWGYQLCLPPEEVCLEHVAVQLGEDGTWKSHHFGALSDRDLWLAAVALYHRKERGNK